MRVLCINRFFFAYTTQTRQAEALFHAPHDTLAEFSLSDGSELKLDRGSKIRAHYSTNERNIELIEGEAHFEVAKDPARRFIVDIDNSKVIAIGTAFNVNSWSGGFSVDVTEGVVEISSALEKQHYRVTAGEGFSYLGADKINRWTFDVDEYKDWRQGVIDAKSMSFAEVVSKLTRYSDVPIKIIDPPIKDYIVVGIYDIYSVDETLKILSEILDLDVKRTDSVIMVARGNSVDL
ncbi:FecR family protein [Teredinibacter turnerae]|uniref:FecR family protein n=1 Tax=Teredinibacter turnerae TaxID=2426 RepID=UPI00037090BB|nr:FecR domain-containing protein [Teredinibacter turnerae]